MTAQNAHNRDTNIESFDLNPKLVAAEAHDLGHLLRQARRELSTLAVEDPKFARLSRLLAISQEYCDGLMEGAKILSSPKLSPATCTHFDLGQLIKHEIEMLTPHASASMLSFKFESKGIFINGNQTLLARAMRNLLINAIAASYPNSEIKIDLKSLERDLIEVSVTNSGRAPEHSLLDCLPTLSKSAAITSGLGLFVASRVAMIHGGTLTGSHENGLTSFKLSIKGNS